MKLVSGICAAVALLLCPLSLSAGSSSKIEAVKIGFVSARACFDQSKEGQKARDMLESLNKQMNSSLEELDKKIEEISHKLNDEDVRDSMTPEAEKELQEKYESLSQEREIKRMQFGQQMQQTQMLAMQQVFDKVGRASEAAAKELGLGSFFSEESAFYYSPELDMTELVIKKMDKIFDEEQKAAEQTQKKAETKN